ncbi:MAG: hypothetical protein KAH54_12365 [Candidatus Sabulitectum sp.]|nr:hypothetical protein [Candidatus Sabulitectum sp.]
MLRKEIIDTLKQTAFVLSFLLLIPLVYWVNSMRLTSHRPFSHYAGAGVALSIFLLVFTLAYNMFSSEDSDSASEYLKSLPFTGWKLLAVKILPRLAVSWLFILGYCAFIWFLPAQISSNDALFLIGLSITELLMIIVIPLLVMLSGFLLGTADRKNPVLVAAFLLITLYPLVPGPLLAVDFFNKVFVHSGSQITILMSFPTIILLPSIASICVLLPLYRSWDCTSKRERTQAMLKRIAIPVGLIAAAWGFAFVQR